jgi:excinuclease ABC subunit A
MTSKTKSAPVAQAPIIDSSIQVHGARVHNLKNVTVSFPRNKLIVVII